MLRMWWANLYKIPSLLSRPQNFALTNEVPGWQMLHFSREYHLPGPNAAGGHHDGPDIPTTTFSNLTLHFAHAQMSSLDNTPRRPAHDNDSSNGPYDSSVTTRRHVNPLCLFCPLKKFEDDNPIRPSYLDHKQRVHNPQVPLHLFFVLQF